MADFRIVATLYFYPLYAIYPSRAISRLLSQARLFLRSATRNQKSTVRHLASTSLPSDSPRQSLLKIQIFPPSNPHARHLAAAFTIHKRSPSSGCTRNHVHTQRLSFFKIPHQNPYTTARHLATMSKTRNQGQKPETGNTHTDRRLARTQTTYDCR